MCTLPSIALRQDRRRQSCVVVQGAKHTGAKLWT
jgi:hypothetical protein